jgi:carbon-monoxide dehydrogenase medium subunit
VKPASFEYHAPESVAEVVELLAAHGDDAKPLAGGQSLVPLLALRLARFDHLIDLNKTESLAAVERSDGSIRIGSMTRQAVVESDPAIAAGAPLFALATPHIGHFQIRNRGTVGGSIAHADPAAEYPAVAVALDATLEIRSASGGRVVAAANFFDGAFSTAIEDDELLVAIDVPVWSGPSGFAIREVSRRHGDFALIGAVVGLQVDIDMNIDRAAVVLFGAGSRPQRLQNVEAELLGRNATTMSFGDLGRLASESLDVIDDGHASGSYRRRVGDHVTGQAIASAAQRAVEESEVAR